MGEAWACAGKSILPPRSSPFRLFSVHRIKCSCVPLPSPLQPLQPHLDLWSEESPSGPPLPLPSLGCEYGEVVGQGDNEIAGFTLIPCCQAEFWEGPCPDQLTDSWMTPEVENCLFLVSLVELGSP